jgi:hypothetical protein
MASKIVFNSRALDTNTYFSVMYRCINISFAHKKYIFVWQTGRDFKDNSICSNLGDYRKVSKICSVAPKTAVTVLWGCEQVILLCDLPLA